MSKFVIKLTSEVAEKDINLSCTTSMKLLTKSIDATKCVIEFCESELAMAYFINDKWYTNTEILEEMAKSEWTPEE